MRVTLCQVFEFFERRRRVSPFLGNPESGQEAMMGEKVVEEQSKEEEVEEDWAFSSSGRGEGSKVGGGLIGRKECLNIVGQERQLSCMFTEAIMEVVMLVWRLEISSSATSSKLCKEGHVKLRGE